MEETNPTEQEHPTLAKAFETLSQAPEERLLSLTYKMGNTLSEELVHAMCLILLKRLGDARAKLAGCQSSVGNFLAEMIKVHRERLNCSHIGGFMSADSASLLVIARIFAVLVQERLCDKSLRDQAYCTSLASSRATGLRSVDVEEEVKQVCGPHVVNSRELSGETYNLTSLSQSGNSHDEHPSSGFTSHTLEISSPTVANDDNSNPLSLHTPTASDHQNQSRTSPDKSTHIFTNHQPPAAKEKASVPKQCQDDRGPSQIVTSKNSHLSWSPKDDAKLQGLTSEQSPPDPANSCHSSDIDETFYAFVILHEAEDAVEAQRLKDKIEEIISGVGATFSDDFAQPGRSTLRCLEDAIENSAFTLLLLTQNFKSNLCAASADSAIVNSLEHHHKLNSVIPLLPRDNRLSSESFPLILRTKVPLDERNPKFQRNASKAISADKVKRQKRIWMQKQRLKKLHEEQEWLREENVRNADLRRETERLARLRLGGETQLDRRADGPPSPGAADVGWPQNHHIHIENAQNVMIGNHATMNIEHASRTGD